MKQFLAFVFVFSGLAPLTSAHFDVKDAVPSPKIDVQVDVNGHYTIHTTIESWSFAGSVFAPNGVSVRKFSSSDAAGTYNETEFTPIGNVLGQPRYSIKIYEKSPVVLFSKVVQGLQANRIQFPELDRYPQGVQQLSSRQTEFAPTILGASGDAPWVFFAPSGASFILSPANHFMVSNCFKNEAGVLSVGIEPQVLETPSSLTVTSVLAFGNGINQSYSNWGTALTRISGKIVPPNDADAILATLGYWTDNRSSYWYNDDLSLGYQGTLEAINEEFLSQGIRLGHLQIDSWWYSKGGDPTADPPLPVSWKHSNYEHGIFLYETTPELFPNGLAFFQARLNLPLVTHARWIDPSSPYTTRYRLSNQVAVDPLYWDMIMKNLKQNGVAVYEQDWLNSKALPRLDRLDDADNFLDEMAAAAANYGLGLQYCMPLARHFLQGSRYSNLRTIRPSGDGFERSRWNQFLYGSRLASALGIWPWTDVFFSQDRASILLATLSGGIVGVGDRLSIDSQPTGDLDPRYCSHSLHCTPLNAGNIKRAIRADGVVVKPDTSLAPIDASYIGLSGLAPNSPPMIAVSTTDGDDGRHLAAYIFSYAQGTQANAPILIRPQDFDFAGDTYVYDYFPGKGQRLRGNEVYSANVSQAGSYFVIFPINPMTTSLLGDLSLFVPLGRKRIEIDSTTRAKTIIVHFSPGESQLSISGYVPDSVRPTEPEVLNGTIAATHFDRQTGLVTWDITRSKDPTAVNSADVVLRMDR